MKQTLSLLGRGKNRDEERLSPLSNVNELVVIEKEVGLRFPGVIILDMINTKCIGAGRTKSPYEMR